jgi:hypothetical protein
MPSREGGNGKVGRGKDLATVVTYQHNLSGDKAAKALWRRRRRSWSAPKRTLNMTVSSLFFNLETMGITKG